jgi:hypothetical protein
MKLIRIFPKKIKQKKNPALHNVSWITEIKIWVIPANMHYVREGTNELVEGLGHNFATKQ